MRTISPSGQKALLEAYPDTYEMNVYPTHRSAAYPQRIYDKTIENAKTAELGPGGNGVTGAINGIPFPIPQNGQEAIWNHLASLPRATAPPATSARRRRPAVAVTRWSSSTTSSTCSTAWRG